MLAAASLVLLAGGWFVYSSLTDRGDVRVRVLDVTGYTDEVAIWMPFRLTLELTNVGARSTAVRRIDVEPDLDGFNEAYGSAAPYDLSPPILLEAGATSTHQADVTLLNAAQLPERRYTLVFRVRLETDDGPVTAEFPAEFDFAREPARRAL
jgi:hypothetical protein